MTGQPPQMYTSNLASHGTHKICQHSLEYFHGSCSTIGVHRILAKYFILKFTVVKERNRNSLSVLKAFAKVLNQYPSHKIKTLNQRKLNKKSAIMCVHII